METAIYIVSPAELFSSVRVDPSQTNGGGEVNRILFIYFYKDTSKTQWVYLEKIFLCKPLFHTSLFFSPKLTRFSNQENLSKSC